MKKKTLTKQKNINIWKKGLKTKAVNVNITEMQNSMRKGLIFT